MSAAKKSSAKAKAKAAPIQMEYSGHIIEGNIWFKLGLSKTENKMLRSIAQHAFTKKITSAFAVRRLIQAALAHYDKLAPLMLQDSDYRVSEGFKGLDDYLKKVIEHQHAMFVKLNRLSK